MRARVCVCVYTCVRVLGRIWVSRETSAHFDEEEWPLGPQRATDRLPGPTVPWCGRPACTPSLSQHGGQHRVPATQAGLVLTAPGTASGPLQMDGASVHGDTGMAAPWGSVSDYRVSAGTGPRHGDGV